jgi:molybdopterin-guanine dinucleotide biosynthesis protein A
MGRPKAWLRLDNECLLQRVVRIVATVVSPVVVASRRGLELPPLPGVVSVAFDADELAGPLSGIVAGFDSLAGRCDAALVAACDHALLSPAFVGRMIELLADHDAVVPECDGQLFPTVAVYRLRTRPLLGQLLAAGELRAKEFALRCDARRATPADFADVDPNLDALRNINTPEDYREARRTTTADSGEPTTRDDAMDPIGPEA